MTATERFRLKLFSPMHLSIVWDSKRHGYVPGDCQVVAFSAGAEAETPTLAPMTIDEIRAYVADRTDIWLASAPTVVYASVNGALYAFRPLDQEWFTDKKAF